MYTAVSAPGKVLLAGGYLVLDRAYSGLVFGLSARIHVIVEDSGDSSTQRKDEILVRSPQFQNASWRYTYHVSKDHGGVEVVQKQESVVLFLFPLFLRWKHSRAGLFQQRQNPFPSLGLYDIRNKRRTSVSHSPHYWHSSSSQTSSVYHVTCSLTLLHRRASSKLYRNPFVETALVYALTYISAVTDLSVIRPTTITILADDDYYSQGSDKSSTASSSGQFSDFGVRLQDAHKTGLGSSAALVTAFTGAVLSHYLSKSQIDISSTEGSSRLHNLAQAAHCAAQGKVGSGFDVAAAVYGTCVYRRFSPSILSGLGEPGSVGFSSRVQQIVENTDSSKKWDTEIIKGGAQIPVGMSLIMCDVDCGSETVGMVKKVLEWHKDDPSGAKLLWDALQKENETLATRLASGSVEELTSSFETVRNHIRDMGTRSGVPIEPEEQTTLLDALTSKVDGVCGGVVPGAGGYDAIVLLVRDDEHTMSSIKSFLVDWSTSKSSQVKMLRVKGEMEGVRREERAAYTPWLQE